MKRNLQKFINRHFDMIVIGSGIYGACVARDAALRGLSVALIEKDDFGAATSSNSLKIIHGGLRYLQDGNLKLVRSMINERAAWMRVAPHLVHPLPFLMPTYGQFTRSKLAMRVALTLNDGLGFDRNQHVNPQRHLPNGRILSRSATESELKWIDPEATGGALWYDAQIFDTERLLISIVQSAAHVGATVANYVQANGFKMDGGAISEVVAEDVFTGQRLNIRAKQVVNCSGAWVDEVLGLFDNRSFAPTFPSSVAINLIVRRLPLDCGAGLRSTYRRLSDNGQDQDHSRMLFITPWQDYTIVGTWHERYGGHPQDFRVTEEMIHSFISEVNTAYPVAKLKRSDVYRAHYGFLPLDEDSSPNGEVKLLRESEVRDHAQTDGVENLITVSGVKYTTARQSAEQVVDLALRKLDHLPLRCETGEKPIYGGQIPQFNDFLGEALSIRPTEVSEESMTHLVYSYGSAYSRILNYIAERSDLAEVITAESPVLKAEIVEAVRQEMAQTLADVVLRRTPLCAVETVDDQSLRTCAALMADELGWDQAKCEQEIAAVRTPFAAGSSLPAQGAS